MALAPAVEWYRLGSRRRPPTPGRRLLLSSRDRWEGLRVDLIDLTGPSDLPENSLGEHVLVSHLDGPARTDIWFAGQQSTGDVLPGDVCIVPAGTPYAVRRERPGRIVVTLLRPDIIEEVAEDSPGLAGARLQPHFCARDPLLSELLNALTDEVLADNPGGALYAETLAAAVAAQLLRRHSLQTAPERRRGGLSARSLRAITEYIEAHLADPIRLKQLAAIEGMSTYQLARRFKESIGIPPHQYVLRRRLERAKELLRQPEVDLLEVALACGFSSQSHFATSFRLVTGVTPRRFRDAS